MQWIATVDVDWSRIDAAMTLGDLLAAEASLPMTQRRMAVTRAEAEAYGLNGRSFYIIDPGRRGPSASMADWLNVGADVPET